MQTFDLFLVDEDGRAPQVDALRGALATTPHLRSTPGDPSRFIYYNDDTTVLFNLLLNPELFIPDASDADGEEDPDNVRRRMYGVLPDEEDIAAGDEEAGSDEPAEIDDEESDEDSGSPVELSPVAVSIPLLRPSFFLREALAVLRNLGDAGGLTLVVAHEGGHESGTPDEDTVLREWLDANRAVARALDDPAKIHCWSPERSEAFYRFASDRARLEKEYSHETLDVPRLHPARHRGATRALSIWRTDRNAVLPRACDLILLQRPRERRGLLGRRRTAIEEGIAEAEKIWRILGPFCEVRQDPVPVVIYRQAANPPPQVAEGLESLELEPVENVRRTELAGVVDFDLAPHSAAGGPP